MCDLGSKIPPKWPNGKYIINIAKVVKYTGRFERVTFHILLKRKSVLAIYSIGHINDEKIVPLFALR